MHAIGQILNGEGLLAPFLEFLFIFYVSINIIYWFLKENAWYITQRYKSYPIRKQKLIFCQLLKVFVFK